MQHKKATATPRPLLPGYPGWGEFIERLAGPEACNFRTDGWTCLGTWGSPPGSSARWDWMNRRSTPPRPVSCVAAGIAIARSSSTSITQADDEIRASRFGGHRSKRWPAKAVLMTTAKDGFLLERL